MIARNSTIVEETAEIHDLLQRIPVVPPSFAELQGHLHTTCLSATRLGHCACLSFYSKEIDTKNVAKT